jgi:hypothetical protein
MKAVPKAAITVLRVLRRMDKKSKIHEPWHCLSAHPPNPPFQPTRVSVWRVQSGFTRTGG